MAVIEVHGLTYTYPGAASPALRDISFQVEAGQLVAVIGANGAGKSSLCLALAGLIPSLFQGQMQGAVAVCGMDTRQHNPGQFAGRVGLVLQNPANQLSGMRYTVYEEVAFGLENLGVPRNEMPGRIEHALQQVGLVGLGERSPYTLSGGQQQRLALASILAMQPAVLVLDEPTAMLDPQGRRELWDLLDRLHAGGLTLLMDVVTLVGIVVIMLLIDFRLALVTLTLVPLIALAINFFRRKARKAVITGGDRADVQLAALETNTRCIVLTGNLPPSVAVTTRAEELGVPMILVETDTLTAVERMDALIGRMRLHDSGKAARIREMLERDADVARLLAACDID